MCKLHLLCAHFLSCMFAVYVTQYIMSCPCIQHFLRARNVLLRERQTLLFSYNNIFVVVLCCTYFCSLFLRGNSLSVFVCQTGHSSCGLRFIVFPPCHLFIFHSLFEMSPRLPLSLSLIYINWPFGLLLWLQHKWDCSVFGLRLCLSTRSVFSASPWTLRSSHWCSTQALRLYEHLSTSSFPALASFSSASYIIVFSLCVFH